MTSEELIVDRVERKEVSRVKHLECDLSEVYPGGQPVYRQYVDEYACCIQTTTKKASILIHTIAPLGVGVRPNASLIDLLSRHLQPRSFPHRSSWADVDQLVDLGWQSPSWGC